MVLLKPVDVARFFPYQSNGLLFSVYRVICMAVKIPLLVLFFCFFSLMAFGLSQDISVVLFHDGSGNVQHTIFYRPDENLTFSLLASPSGDIAVTAGTIAVPFERSDRLVRITPPLGTDRLQLSYSTRLLTDKTGEIWSIRLADVPPNLSRLRIRLPAHTQIHSFSPQASIFSDDSYLVVAWDAFRSNNLLVQLTYSELPDSSAVQDWVLGLGGILFFLLLILSYFVFFARTIRSSGVRPNTVPPGFSPGQSEIARTLSEKEKRVLEQLVKGEGCTQKSLEQKTGLSKATLSRTLKNLEQKDILQLTPDGYSNRVYFKTWFKTK